MSLQGGSKPGTRRDCPAELELIIVPRTVDIGGFEVHRALPSQDRQTVGPFIFWDQMGPGRFEPGHGVDVRPHPHIGLSTVTYLFEGSLDHKDSLGNAVRIVPGDVNLMSAGRGIVHSERTGADIRLHRSRLSGIQSWLAQPAACEEGDPAFTHFQADVFPTFESSLISGKLLLGEFEGNASPVPLQWQTLYLEVRIKQGGIFKIPPIIEERALHLVRGEMEIDNLVYGSRQMVVLRPGHEVVLKARDDLHVLLLGGAPLDGPRYIWWNLVSSSVEKIKSAAADWKNNKFATVPGDEEEFIPLPTLAFPEP